MRAALQPRGLAPPPGTSFGAATVGETDELHGGTVNLFRMPVAVQFQPGTDAVARAGRRQRAHLLGLRRPGQSATDQNGLQPIRALSGA
jgi:hypothetical protein